MHGVHAALCAWLKEEVERNVFFTETCYFVRPLESVAYISNATTIVFILILRILLL